MTKQEWKNKLIDLLISEPEIGNRVRQDKNEMMDYLTRLDKVSDKYYGISWEILIAIEKHLGI